MRQRLLFLVAAALAFTVPPAGAYVQERPGPAALTQAKLYGYATPVVVMAEGEELAFVNLDIEMHDFIQDVETDGFGAKKPMRWCKGSKKKDGHAHDHGSECPLFWTPLISLGEMVKIEGLQNVKSGESYSFLCTIHHGMKGKLVVL